MSRYKKENQIIGEFETLQYLQSPGLDRWHLVKMYRDGRQYSDVIYCKYNRLNEFKKHKTKKDCLSRLKLHWECKNGTEKIDCIHCLYRMFQFGLITYTEYQNRKDCKDFEVA